MDYQFQYRENAEALYEALVEDPFYNTMEKAVSDAQDGKEAMLKYLDYSMVEAAQFGRLLLPEKPVCGASVWSLPLDNVDAEQKSQSKKTFLLEHMGQQALDTYNEICNFMSAQTDNLFDDGTWYLSILGISPEHQGKGLGPSLITPILDKTDQHNTATFLETFTPRNMSFYRRLGYEEVGAFVEPTINAKYWVMVRKP